MMNIGVNLSVLTVDPMLGLSLLIMVYNIIFHISLAAGEFGLFGLFNNLTLDS